MQRNRRSNELAAVIDSQRVGRVPGEKKKSQLGGKEEAKEQRQQQQRQRERYSTGRPRDCSSIMRVGR